MPTQAELFELIKSLSPSEKRYFKVNAGKGGDSKSNYVQLFEAMDAQTEYNGQKLKAKHGKKAFVKFLSAEKKHLREQIMKYMRAYHSNRSIVTRINELLQNETFYRDKGLKQLRYKTIQTAKDLATEFEQLHLLQEILEREIAFVEEFEEKVLTEPIVELIAELKRLSSQQETCLELLLKNKEIFAYYRSGADVKDPTVRNRVDMLMAEVERYRGRLGNSFHLNFRYHKAYGNYFMLIRNPELTFHHSEKEYQLYQQHPHFKEEDPCGYKICLANLISRAQTVGKTDRFLEAIQELKQLPINSFNEEGEVFQNVYFAEHLYYINAGEFGKAEALIPAIEEGLTKYAAKVNKARLLTFQFNIMIMYFIMHRFKEALIWAEKLMADKSEIKQDVRNVTKVLLPIIHFELGHVDLVDSFTRSAYRGLLKQKRLHKFERLMVNYLKQMPLSQDHEDFSVKLHAFNEQLQLLVEDPNEKVTFGMEEMSLWVVSKLTGTKMSEQLKE